MKTETTEQNYIKTRVLDEPKLTYIICVVSQK